MRRMMWVHPLNELRLDKGEFYTLYQDLRHFAPKFFNMYRMSVPKFDRLLRKISPLIEKKWTNMREPLSAEHKLVLTLRLTFKNLLTKTFHFKMEITKLSKIHFSSKDTQVSYLLM